MAVYKRNIIDIDLEQGNIHRSWLNHSIGLNDRAADHFGVRVFRDGEPVNLTGVSVQGVFLPPQGGSPISITSGNIVSGNVAEVVLPAACYNYDGQFCLAIRLVDVSNSVTDTVRIVDGIVDNTHSGGTISPLPVEPTWAEIKAAYEQAVIVVNKSVRYDTNQSLTEAQKLTARTNIGAVGLGTANELAMDIGALAEGSANNSYIDLGNKWMPFRRGYYSTPAVGSASSYQSNSQYFYALVMCQPGDILHAHCYGNSTVYAWAFLDSNLNVISRGGTGNFEGIQTAPASTSYVLVNVDISHMSTGFYAWVGEERTGEKISDLKSAMNKRKEYFGTLGNEWHNGSWDNQGYHGDNQYAIYSEEVFLEKGKRISYDLKDVSNITYRIIFFNTSHEYIGNSDPISGKGTYILANDRYVRLRMAVNDTTISSGISPSDGSINVSASIEDADYIPMALRKYDFDNESFFGIVPDKWYCGDYNQYGIVTNDYCIFSSEFFMKAGQILTYDLEEDNNFAYKLIYFNLSHAYIGLSSELSGKGTMTINADAYVRFRIGAKTAPYQKITEDMGYQKVKACINKNTYLGNAVLYGMQNIDLSDVAVYSKFVPGGVFTNVETVDLTDIDYRHLNNDENEDYRYYHIIIPCKPGERFNIQAVGFGNGGTGDTEAHKQYVFIDESNNIVKSADSVSITQAYVNYDPDNYVFAPNSAKFLIVNHRIVLNYVWYTPKVYKMSNNPIVNTLAKYSYGKLPYVPVNDWERYVVATYKSYIVICRNNIVYRSDDCGKTWSEGINISSALSGDNNKFILGTHIFDNGCFAFFTRKYAYYIESDWEAYSTATVYDEEGNVINTGDLATHSAFKFYNDYAERKFITVNDELVDMLVFGNYHYGYDENAYIWYSIDRGHTYRIAFDFGTFGTSLVPRVESKVIVDGNPLYIRHVHGVLYVEDKDRFICMTGDNVAVNASTGLSECGVWELQYDDENDNWSIEKLGVGKNYKWTSAAIWNKKIYYANDNTPGTVLYCDYDDIGDLTKHTMILDGMFNDPRHIIFGANGDMIVTQCDNRNIDSHDYPDGVDTPLSTKMEARAIYYSADRKSFTRIFLPIEYLKGPCEPAYVKPLTTDGHAFIGTYNRFSYANAADEGMLPSICLDNFIRTRGFANAFTPNI